MNSSWRVHKCEGAISVLTWKYAPGCHGNRFVTAKELELYQGLYQTDVLILRGIFTGPDSVAHHDFDCFVVRSSFCGPGPRRTADRLLQRGAKVFR